MKNEKRTTLTIEFTDEEYSMLSKAAAGYGYGSVKEFAEQMITRMYKGGRDEADENHSA